MTQPEWKNYEAVAREILRHLASELRIKSIDGEAILPGQSGTNWNLEGTATRVDGEGFLILECRRYTTKRLNQESLGGLAFRIQDTGGSGGIVVSPLPLQKGAELVAQSENIVPVQIEEWSTAENYLARVLGKTFHGIGITDSMGSFASVASIELRRKSDSDEDS